MHDNKTITRIALTIFILTITFISYKVGRHIAYAETQPEISRSVVNLVFAEGQLDVCREIINGLTSEGKLFVINGGG